MFLYICNPERGIGDENYIMSVIICSHVAHMQDMRNLSVRKNCVFVLFLPVNGSLCDLNIKRRTDNNMDQRNGV